MIKQKVFFLVQTGLLIHNTIQIDFVKSHVTYDAKHNFQLVKLHFKFQ